MHKPVIARLTWLLACIKILLLSAHGAETSALTPESGDLTNVAQLERAASSQTITNHHYQLEGDIWWVNLAEDKFVLHDATATAQVEMDLAGQPLSVGTRVRIEGDGTISKSGAGFRLGVKGPVVDNNGVHGMIEKSGAVFLKAGRQPMVLDWFNGVEKSGLAIEYEGPGISRTNVPGPALFHTDQNGALAGGLSFSSYEAAGEILPDFKELVPVSSGVTSNFDITVAHRPDHVALRFSGWLQVPDDGLYTFHLRSDDGSQLFVGVPSLHLAATGPANFPAPRPIVIGQLMNGDGDGQWASTEGTITFVGETTDGLKLELSSATGRVKAEIADHQGLSPALLLNRRIRATGVCQTATTTDGQKIADTFLISGSGNIEFLETNRDFVVDTNNASLPVLTTCAEVHHLKREEAERGYPVKIRGVVTCLLPERQAFTLQDSTRGLYVVNLSTNHSSPPQIGEFLEVGGTTDPSLFAPIVNATRLDTISAGHLPEPLHPTWDQLLNGSLDAQFIEIQGIITTVGTNGVTLLTRDGRINLELRVVGMKPEKLADYEDALVRIRGCLFASWDYVTHKVKMGEIRIYGASLSVDQPAPADLFVIPKKTAAELLLFDPQAGVFQRVKVSGQILYVHDTEYFMTDGTSGLRFIAKKPLDLQAGDTVDVVGFPELSGASPLLREAVARKSGHATLPPAKSLSSDDLIHADYDATLVRVKGTLSGIRQTGTEQVLEIQNGVRTFIARLADRGAILDSLPVGSLLELTGVYAGQGGNKAISQDISSFELFLNSAGDIKVLARPPWWNLERLLVIVGALAVVLVITVLWITQLHRKVEERTRQLEAQIRERQFAEQQRAMEQERARVAQDLHDELGSGLTEISMLVTVGKSASAGANDAGQHLEQISERADQMVTALDEIVWAMNPKHDSLASLVSYSCLYADRFLKLANIGCRLKGGVELPDRMVSSTYRHEFFLAFKEALTNVVRHSGATEVRLGVQLVGERLRLSIADNGGGLAANISKEGSDGLVNMRTRLEKMGGRFAIASKTGRGTTLRFYMPLN